MKKKKVSWLLIIGAVLILGSVCMLAAFRIQASMGVRESRAAAEKILALLPERTPGQIQPDIPMPALEIDGKDYIALLEIPGMGVCLPVAAQQEDYLPGRFWGSVYSSPFVIGGRDHPGLFDFCSKIEYGTPLTVTDMTGTQFSYTVARVDRAEKAENQWLLDENFDLTLYCRGTFSSEYIAVRCNLTWK